MGKNRNKAEVQEMRTQRRDRAIVQVPLRDVKDGPRAVIEAEWDRREQKALELRRIKGNAGRTDANAVKSEGEAYGGGMRRGKNTVASDVQPGKHPRSTGAEIVRPEVDDLTVADGTTDDRSSIGEFVPGPKTDTIDIGGVPSTRRRR